MWFWWFLFLCNLLIPVIMLVSGWIMWKHPPGHINGIMGYRTTRSMKNMDTWKFAHEYCGRLWWKLGWILLIPSIIIQLPFYHASDNVLGIVGAILCTITSIPFVLNHPYVPMNMVPFIDVLMGRGDFFRQIVLNIIMTVPFGFLFPLTQNRTAKFSRTVFFCFLMSLGIEILQPLINGSRSSDITDLITNVIGGMLGYAFYVVFKPVTFRILTH